MYNVDYYFGSTDNTYEKALDGLYTTDVHSYKTSSIPLAEFWNPKNSFYINKLLNKIGWTEEDFDNSKKFFEFPVKPKINNQYVKKAKPSMTDLMIRYNDINGFSEKQIAVEGKFTEDLYETISEWKKSKSANSNKDDVLKSWYSYIENYCDFSDCHNSLFLIMKKKQIYSFGESQVINCLTDNFEALNLHCDCIYTNEVFKTEYKKLREITWQRGVDKEVYQKRIKAEHPDLSDAFDKSKSEKRYNPKTPDEAYSKKELENYSLDEEWRFLTNPGYTKYAVSSEGRVAFYFNGKYHVIFQDDNNGDGYLRLDPNGEYNLDHNIEVYKLIAMGFLGKRIGDGYDVHHKINDGYNCRKDNLVLLTRAQHNIVHMSEEQLKKIDLDEYLMEE